MKGTNEEELEMMLFLISDHFMVEGESLLRTLVKYERRKYGKGRA